MTNISARTFKASLLVAASGILYGFLGYLGTQTLRQNMTVETMLFWRFFIAGLWIACFAIKKHLTHGIFQNIDQRTVIFMFFLGAIGYAGSSLFYFVACHYTSTGLAMVIFFSYPILLALVSWLLYRSAFDLQILLTLIAMIVGLLLLHDSKLHQLNFLGIFYSLIAAGCYVFYILGSKKIATQKAIDSYVLTTLVCFACAVIFYILAIFSQHFSFPDSLSCWVYLILLGVFATAIPIQFMLLGLKEISSMRASIISVLEPLVTLMVGIILLNESITYLQVIGCTIILASALLVQFHRSL